MHVCGCRALVSPHETPTRPLGPPRGLKGLVHKLNAPVIPYESGFYFPYLVALSILFLCSRTSKV